MRAVKNINIIKQLAQTGVRNKLEINKKRGATMIATPNIFQMVGQGRIELPTLGFSVLGKLKNTEL